MIGPVILDWYGCDLHSGQIVAELPALSTDQALSRKLGASTTSSLTLALDGAPAGWESATTPGRTMLVPVDRATGQPVTAGIVLTRAGGTDPALSLGIASPEAYMDRRYAAAGTWVGADQAVILTTTAGPLLTQAPPFVFDAPGTGTPASYSVADGDDRTILSVWQELMDQDAGPEWTVDVRWNASRTGFELPVRVRAASGIGNVTTTPMAVFDLPGCISAYTLTESYEDGKGATTVRAYGDGEGDARLRSADHSADALLAAGYALWEYRFTPASATTDPVALDASAAGTLTAMATGSTVWDVTATASAAPRLGQDWALGDSIGVQIARSPRHPGGAATVARCWAWELDPAADTVRPVLVQEET
ncbi:hypothetical protein [Streptomyces sp. NBC_01477]|uniref:hypothetical protein n=1 Tax=Streptomyces sp. NBC_01477 TaxID=2976015 RepID=UPI002E334901|nr:hypothetical protein [Streptomyces sp. NBC_01477]